MKLFEKEEWKILWPFYINVFITFSFFLIFPYWVIYFSEIGLTFTQIGIVWAIFSFFPILFEIPTGAIADIFGRKFAVISEGILTSIILFLIIFTRNFYLLLIIMALWGVIKTLSSGSYDAWVIDLLKFKRKKRLIHNFYIKIQSFSSLGVLISGVLATLTYKYLGMNSLWIISSISCLLVSILLIFTTKENFKKHKFNLKNSFSRTLRFSKEGIKFSIKHEVVKFIILASFFISLAGAVSNLSWQPFLKNVGLPLEYLGIFYSGMAFFLIIVPFLQKPLLRLLKLEKYYLSLRTILELVLVLLIYFVISPLYAIILLILIAGLDELTFGVRETYLQNFIPSKIRATVGSVSSMIRSLAGAIGLIIGGIFVDTFGPQLTIVYSAFFLIPAIIFYLLIKEPQSLKNQNSNINLWK